MNAKRNMRNILVFGAIAILFGATFLPNVTTQVFNIDMVKGISKEKSVLEENRETKKVINGIISIKIETTGMNLGNILYVGGSGPGNYTHIQDAIDNASDGDTIFVYNGTYYENVVINKSINLIGENEDTTIIDGNGSGNVVNVTADLVKLSGFMIRNSGDFGFRDYGDAGINIHSNYNSISDNNILNNYDGVYLHYSISNTLSDNNINSNRRWGIRFHCSNNNNVSGNNILNHRRGIHLDTSSNNNISGNNILNNGRGIYLSYSNNNCISGNNIFDNTKGIYLSYSNNNTISNNNVNSNKCFGINLYHSNTNAISSNNISNSLSAGIDLSCSHKNTISGNNILNNSCGISTIFSNKNIFSGNNIISNEWSGIVLLFSSFDVIKHNNFIKNYKQASFYYDCDSLLLSFSNRWNRNYWDDWPGLIPRPIFGSIEAYPGEPFPWLNFDWHPLIKPYGK